MAEDLPPHIATLQRQSYQSTRAEGMAGTGLGSVTDADAAFLNPALIGGGYTPTAGLNHVSFPGLAVGSTTDSLEFGGELLGSDELGKGLASVVDKVGSDQGMHYRQQMFPNFVYSRLLFGVLQTATADVHGYRLGTNQDVDAVFSRSELQGVFGFSVPMGPRALVGATARYGLRWVMAGVVEDGPGTNGSSVADVEKSGQWLRGSTVDVGFNVLLAPKAGVLASLVGRNVAKSLDTFQSPGSSDDALVATTEATDVDVGLAWTPRFKRALLSPSLSLEAHEVARSDLELEDKIRLGAELVFGNNASSAPFALRLGHNLSGWSYGASVDLFLCRLEGAVHTKAVHLGTESRVETHYLLRTSWDLGR
jgi:hypothetical protein